MICNSTKLINEKYKKTKFNPKVSVISPVYNREKYLIRFINSIHNQKFKEIEIILIDDFSDDNSIKIIEKLQKFDKRILLLKNKKNKGTFICRNQGVLKSKGEYLIFPDPDDIIPQDIIDVCYKFVKKYHFEMIRFMHYLGKGRIKNNNFLQKLQSYPIYQPELSTYLFYGLGKLEYIDFNISNKLVKRVTFIRALNLLYKYYLKIYMVRFEDGLMNFCLYRIAKSFFFLKKIGYYYIRNEKTYKEKLISRNHLLYFKFFYLKLTFEFTKNNLHEKNMCNFLLKIIKPKSIYNNIFNLNKNFNFYYDIINMYLKSTFINENNKIYLLKLKNIIKNKIIQKEFN